MRTNAARAHVSQKLAALFGLLITTVLSNSVSAAFIPYAVEADWQAGAGATALETFEPYAVGAQFESLPALGVRFDELSGGGFPVIYSHSENNTPYGRRHLGNFPNGINAINRFDDIVLRPLPGVEITAVGYWNGDGQADTLTALVYDALDNLLGSVGAFKGTFAGFTSDVPISRVVFSGNTGDGWNHLDGLQTNARPTTSTVPEPGSLALVLLGAAVLSPRAFRAAASRTRPRKQTVVI